MVCFVVPDSNYSFTVYFSSNLVPKFPNIPNENVSAWLWVKIKILFLVSTSWNWYQLDSTSTTTVYHDEVLLLWTVAPEITPNL